MEYFRIHTQDISYSTNQPRGIFVAIWKLVDANAVTEDEAKTYWQQKALFEELLPVPPFYKDGNSVKAIVYFKNNCAANELVEKMRFYFAIAEKYGLALYKSSLSHMPNADIIVYEDEFQIAITHTSNPSIITTRYLSQNIYNQGF